MILPLAVPTAPPKEPPRTATLCKHHLLWVVGACLAWLVGELAPGLDQYAVYVAGAPENFVGVDSAGVVFDVVRWQAE
jgi:hypothetical protein